MKITKRETEKANKPKGLFDSIADMLEQAPQAKALLDQEINNLMEKGATPEQLKSLKSKKQMVDLASHPFVQALGPAALEQIRGVAKNFGVR